MNIDRRSAVQGGVLLLAVVLAAAMHSAHVLDSDEGVILSGAWHLRHGLRLYVDFFEIVGPGSFYLVHWAWQALGPSYWAAKLVGACAVGVAALGVHRLAQAAFPAGAAATQPATLPVLPALLFCLLSGFWQTINHNTFSLAGGVWAVVFAARALARGRMRDAAAAGLLAGLTALFLQHRAAVITAGIIVAMLLLCERRRCIPVFAAGVAVGAAPLLCWPIGLIIEQLVLFPLHRYSVVNQLPPALPAIYALCWLGAAWILRGSGNPAVTLLLVLQPALLAGTQRADIAHVSQNIFPLLALLPALAACTPSTRTRRAAQHAAIMAVVVAPAGLVARLPNLQTDDSLRREIVQAVGDACAEGNYLYAGPFLPQIYFETGMRNPTRHSVLLTGFNTAGQFEAAAAALARKAPRCALTQYKMVKKFGYRRDNPVDHYLASYYVPARVWGDSLVLWRRRDSLPMAIVARSP